MPTSSDKLRGRIDEAQHTIPRLYTHLRSIWELLYAPTSAQPEADTPKRGKPSGSPMLTADHILAPAWHRITTHIAKAHRHLTHFPTGQHWQPGRIIGYPCLADVLADRAHSREVARTVGLEELTGALEGLMSTLSHVDEAAGHLTPEGRRAAHGACDEVAAAYRGVPEHLRRPHPQPKQHHSSARTCVNSVNGCRNTARQGGTQCQVCTNYRSRHGRDRVV